MTIAIVGLGYVGLSLACLLSKDNNVISVDIDQRKVGLIERSRQLRTQRSRHTSSPKPQNSM